MKFKKSSSEIQSATQYDTPFQTRELQNRPGTPYATPAEIEDSSEDEAGPSNDWHVQKTTPSRNYDESAEAASTLYTGLDSPTVLSSQKKRRWQFRSPNKQQGEGSGKAYAPAPAPRIGLDRPTVSNPQKKKRWQFKFGNKLQGEVDEDGEYIVDPALPSFGSGSGHKDPTEGSQVDSQLVATMQ